VNSTHSPQDHAPDSPWYRSKGTIAGVMLAIIALFFLIREHWTHLAGMWVYLLLLLCPLMHLFGHGGHGGHGVHREGNSANGKRN